MGKTIIEKIIQPHTKDEVAPGRIVWMDLDIRSARDFGGPNVVKHFQSKYSGSRVADPDKTFFTFDLCVPACSLRYADNQQICRVFAREQGIRVFDVDEGIGSHVLIEKGLARPQTTVVGTDSHLNILGAVGCFGQGMGDVDITFAFKTGRSWFQVPETLKVVLSGDLGPASPKDLTLFLLRSLGTRRAALKAVEFYGEPVRRLSLSGRITLCSMVTEMAGIIGFIPEWEKPAVSEMEMILKEPLQHPQADPDTEYSEIIELNADALPPLVASPHLPTNVQEVRALRDVRIDTGFIGSCTNGRLEDMQAAARILKGRRIKEGITLKIVPATRRVYQEMLGSGVLEDLFASGAIISNPGCGGCAEGHIGLTGRNEVQISTGNRNFEGKQGKGRTYLAAPEVVAASCLTGTITAPEEV
jgi:3-isopropylmalate/(R)-2-methylmalate dehydratase large subunit